MGLNLKTFQTRALTAVVFAAVVLAGIFGPLWFFVILFSIVQIGCWIEYLGLVEKITSSSIDNFIKYFFAICGLALMLLFGLQHVFMDFKYAGISLKVVGWILLLLGLVVIVVQNKKMSNQAKKLSFAGFLYISFSFTLLLHLRTQWAETGVFYGDLEFGQVLICAIIFSIWINDTMAYIVGSFIGKTPFSSISPKKTWEGTIGGAILCVVVIGFLSRIKVGGDVGLLHWVAIAAICAVFGTIGDLFESKLKRMANVKDSGKIMPGHGGFLDRFDSMLIATPFVWLYVQLFF